MWLKTSLLILWVVTCALFTINEAASINPCGPETSKCGDGSCITKDKLCNGKEDCPRGEDERYCTDAEMTSTSMPPVGSCRSDEFTCYDGECIPMLWKCDGYRDCRSSEDELYCYSTTATTEWWAEPTSSSCSPDEFTCHDGKCIPSQYRCDGYRDCQQGEDEYNCGQTEYTTGYPTTRDPYPMTTRDPYPMTTRDPYPMTTTDPYPMTTRDPYPMTTRDPYPMTTRDPYPMTTRDPYPMTTTDPYPMTSRDPSPMTTRDPYVECLHPFDIIGGKCILIDPVVESTWHESRYLCQRLDADLVVLDSLDSYGDLVKFLKKKELTTRDYWVGASDEAVEGVWMWVNYQMVRNGTPLWALYGSGSSYYQEPRSEYASSQDCGYLDKERFYYMDDSDCTEKRAVICEKFLYHETSISEAEMSNINILEVLESSQKKQDATGVHSNFIQKTQDAQSHKSSPEESPVEEKEVEGNKKEENTKEGQVKETLPNKHVETVITEMQGKFLQSALSKNLNQS